MKTNSKTIGNNYERDMSKKLSLWMTDNESDDVLWRDLGSGLRSTVRHKQGKISARDGDIVATDLTYKPFFDFYHVDTKSLGDVHLMLINPKSMKSSQLFSEWRKVSDDAKKFDKVPLMFVKARNDGKIPDFVMFPFWSTPIDYNNIVIYRIDYNDISYSIGLVLLDEFFKENKWKKIIK